MSNGKFPVLIFDHSGFCEELGTSYFQGRYEARTKEQYEALKKYATKEAVVSAEKALKDMTVPKLREIAKEIPVEKYAKLKKPALIKAIEEARKAEEAEENDNPEEGTGEDGGTVDSQADGIDLEGGE